MARISYPTNLSPETADLLRRNGSLNVNLMMAHALPILDGFSKLGRGILRKGKLDPSLRELAILRVGVRCRSDYEWHQHVDFARAVGTREEAIQAVRNNDLSALTEIERVIVDFADEFVGDHEVSPETLARADRSLDAERLVELTITCGYYVMTAGFLKTFAVDIESSPPLGATVAADLRARKP